MVQVYAMPVFDMLEKVLVKKLRATPYFRLPRIARTLYVGEWLICTKLHINIVFFQKKKKKSNKIIMFCLISLLACIP